MVARTTNIEHVLVGGNSLDRLELTIDSRVQNRFCSVSRGVGDTALILRFREDNERLLAIVEPGTDRPPLDAAVVREQLAAQGLSDRYVDEDALARLLTAYAESPERIELPIGERRNGACSVNVVDDKSVASLTLVPPCGGDPVTADQIQDALKTAGVAAGLLPGEIEAALAEGSVTDRVVARGKNVKDGEDATFVSLIPEPEERRPHTDEHGLIDYRDLGQMAAVRAGDPLMRRIPATAGENGYDVSGRELKAKPGKNTPFSPAIRGAKIDPADADLLCAAISGRPIVGPAGVSVEPVVVLPAVDISTGNVDFDGAVNVQGNVSSGMRIRATGDVLISGSVGAARITAGGKVVIKGGVIGGGEADASAEDRAVILCQGPFQASFLEYAQIESSSDILIDDHCMFSTLAAGARVVVGGTGSKTGHIRGGTVSAATLVKAVTFGSPMGVKTTIRVGFDAQHRARLIAVEKEIDANAKREADLQKAVDEHHHEKDEQELAKVVEQLGRLREEAAQIKSYVTLEAAARVVVDRKIHSGTEIHIGNRCWTSHDDHANGVYRLHEGEIVCAAS
jgi:uncharacterized protein